MIRCAFVFLVAAAMAAAVGQAGADPLTIYDIQYTTSATGESPQAGNVVNCAGGVVTHKFSGYKPKLTLQDPAYADGWGGIQVKDWTTDQALFSGVSVGDWVSFGNVEVEEFRGNTLLKFDLESEFNKDGGGNALPAPKLVSLADIAAPVQSTDPADLGWYVADHSAEKYEAMLLRVENVTVGETGLGKARDNYELIGASGTCWASDYMNEAVGADYYHPYVEAGVHFGSATGILEQYTKPSSGLDYYQLLTTTSDDLVVPEPAAGIMLLCGAAALLRRRAARP